MMADSRNDFKLVDYRLTLVIGIVFIGIGAMARMWGMGAFGLVLLGIGLVNKSQWGKEKRWSEMTETERKRQLRGLIAVGVFGLIAIILPVALGL
jgi:hypothetical protein